MPNLGPGEILVILLIALLVFGPRKLPELGKSLGAGIREFRKGTQGLKEEFEGTLREQPAQPVAAQPAPVQTITAAAVIPAPVMVQAVTPQAVTPQAAEPSVAVASAESTPERS